MTLPPLRDWDLVFERHYVYRLIDSDDRLLYVGCTINPVDRLSQHRSRTTEWLLREGRSPEYRAVVSDPMACYDAYTEEARAISEERPKYNRVRGHVFPAYITCQEDLEAWVSDPLRRQLHEAIRIGARP